MNKPTNKLFALFAAGLIWQSSCAAGERSAAVIASPPVTPTPLVKSTATPQNIIADIKTSEIEAQTLLDAGIKFDFTFNADGGTEDGGISTAHGYITSDGIQIGTSRGLYRQKKHAKQDCSEVSKETNKILKKERIEDGERVVAEKKGGGFVVAIRSGNGCYIYDSSSLKHLLAFEKWRDK